MSTTTKGGLKSRSKGRRTEQEIVRLAHDYGLDAARTWRTSQADDPQTRRCDVLILGHPAQVKISRRGFGPLYRVLESVNIAFLRRDRGEWLAVLTAKRLFRLFADYNRELLRDREPKAEGTQ